MVYCPGDEPGCPGPPCAARRVPLVALLPYTTGSILLSASRPDGVLRRVAPVLAVLTRLRHRRVPRFAPPDDRRRPLLALWLRRRSGRMRAILARGPKDWSGRAHVAPLIALVAPGGAPTCRARAGGRFLARCSRGGGISIWPPFGSPPTGRWGARRAGRVRRRGVAHGSSRMARRSRWLGVPGSRPVGWSTLSAGPEACRPAPAWERVASQSSFSLSCRHPWVTTGTLRRTGPACRCLARSTRDGAVRLPAPRALRGWRAASPSGEWILARASVP